MRLKLLSALFFIKVFLDKQLPVFGTTGHKGLTLAVDRNVEVVFSFKITRLNTLLTIFNSYSLKPKKLL